MLQNTGRTKTLEILMQRKKRQFFDSSLTGFFAGFLLPVMVFVVVYFIKEEDISFPEYLESLFRLNALVKLGSLCVFANLLVFMAFIRMQYDRAARGVLGATIIYALVILISKAF